MHTHHQWHAQQGTCERARTRERAALVTLRDGNKQTVEDLIEAFYNFDYDQDGYIPVEDMRDLLADNGYNMPAAEIDEFMEQADPNNSGFVEYRAMAQLLMSDPEKM